MESKASLGRRIVLAAGGEKELRVSSRPVWLIPIDGSHNGLCIVVLKHSKRALFIEWIELIGVRTVSGFSNSDLCE